MLDLPSSEIFVLCVLSQVLQMSLQLVRLFHHGLAHTKMCLQILPQAQDGIESLSREEERLKHSIRSKLII